MPLKLSVSAPLAIIANIPKNLFFAFLSNALDIPLAARALCLFFGRMLNPILTGDANEPKSLLGNRHCLAANGGKDLKFRWDELLLARRQLLIGRPIYLYDNPLLKEPLKLSHVKPLAVGHRELKSIRKLLIKARNT
jgi:hypothetical protein